MKAIFSGFVFLILFTGVETYAQKMETATNNVVSKLANYNKTHLTEKAYLQFDKPYYASGDTMYFKAYVTMGERHELSKISGVLHVDLIGVDNKANQSIKLQLVNGISWGDFALPDPLPQGTYRVRAYTRWMRNAGDGDYFEKDIPIGTLHQNKVPESNTARVKPILSKADLQFFPESGELISGISTKIAFKAIGVNGMGMDVTGIVTDNTAKDVTSFASTHLGMGYFNLKPEECKSYKASITFADGTKEELPLPQISNKGISLTINNDSVDHAAVRIIANPTYFSENKGKAYGVLIYSGGIATTVSCKLDSPTITMDIIKRKLFTGITTVTLFAQNNEPLAERLLFIQNYDQLNLDISTNKDTYNTREKVSLKLNAKTRADSTTIGHFSIAATDESKVQQDENNETTILTNLLLTSDLKGTIEQPNYYFADIGDQSNYDKQKELDLVMLTHGYRHFSWKQVLTNDSTNNAIAYTPETSLAISGTAKSLLGAPLKKATVTLLSAQFKSFISETTDDKGGFNFDNLVFTDSAKFILQAVNSKGKNRTQLIYNQDNPLPMIEILSPNAAQGNNQTMMAYMANNEKQQEELNKMGLGNGKMLNEVKIRDHKNIDIKKVNPLLGFPDQTINGNKILYGGQLSTRLMSLVHYVDFIPLPNGSWVAVSRSGGQMKIYVNDIEMPRDFDINSISTGAIESVEVYTVGQSVLRITTTFGLQAKDVQSIGILPVAVKGYYKAHEFYTPKYEASMPVNHPDLRSTIYWAPELVTDKDGNASIDFYNADGRGNYRVVVEGIDQKGNIGRKVYRYRVE